MSLRFSKVPREVAVCMLDRHLQQLLCVLSHSAFTRDGEPKSISFTRDLLGRSCETDNVMSAFAYAALMSFAEGKAGPVPTSL